MSTADAHASSGTPSSAARRKAPQKRRHIEKVHFKSWRAFALENSNSDSRVKVTHARNLLTRLQWEIIARRPSQAMQLQALLMKDFSHLRTPLAQAGFELLRTSLQSSEQITRLGRYGRRMASLDKRHGKWWLISTSVEEVRLNINRQGVTAEGEPALTASSFSGFSRAIESLSGSIRECDAQSGDCDHDGDVHGSIGLYAHAQLYWVAARFEHLADRNKGASSRVIPLGGDCNADEDEEGCEVGAGRLPFEISPSLWSQQPPPAVPHVAIVRQHRQRLQAMRRAQQWRVVSSTNVLAFRSPQALRVHTRTRSPQSQARGAETRAEESALNVDDEGPPVASGGSSRFGQPSVSMSVSYEAGAVQPGRRATSNKHGTQQRDAYADAIGILAAADFPPTQPAVATVPPGADTSAMHDEDESDDEYVGVGACSVGDGHDDDDDDDDDDDPGGAAVQTQSSTLQAVGEAEDNDDDDDDDDEHLDFDAMLQERRVGADADDAQDTAAVVVEGPDSDNAQLLVLHDPIEAIALAQSAVDHLRVALRSRPDSCTYAACLGQMLSLLSTLIEHVGGGADALEQRGVVDDDADGPNGLSQEFRGETVREMHMRLAENALYDVIGTASPVSMAARELWLHWLQRHAPSDISAIAGATCELLAEYVGSERGFHELGRLLSVIYDADNPGGGAEAGAEMDVALALRRAAPNEAKEAAAQRVTLERALGFVGARIELRPLDVGAWQLLTRVIRWTLNCTRYGASIEFAAVWWSGCMEWWHEACFITPPSTPDAAVAELAAVRCECVTALQALVGFLSGTECSQTCTHELTERTHELARRLQCVIDQE